jgi:hypothetical protein
VLSVLRLIILCTPFAGIVSGESRRGAGKRTWISWHAALNMAACAAFRTESRMKFAYATNLDRKSGVALWRDLRFRYFSRRLFSPHQ